MSVLCLVMRRGLPLYQQQRRHPRSPYHPKSDNAII